MQNGYNDGEKYLAALDGFLKESNILLHTIHA